MTATTSTRSRRPTGTTLVSTPPRYLLCIGCGTWKKERGYALCAECYAVNGTLSPAWFRRFAPLAERETVQYSFRSHPAYLKACRIYSRRRQRAQEEADGALSLPHLATARRDRADEDGYDGLGPHDLLDLIDWERHGVELPEPERSGHQELSDEWIERWDARVDRWAAARGVSLADRPAPEIRPWGYAMEVEGALVWTDDPG